MAEHPKRQTVSLLLWAMDRAFAQGKGLEASSLLDALAGLTAEQAAWSPRAGVRSIWEIVNHVAHWKGMIVRALNGDEISPEGQWPPIQAVTEADWAKDTAYLKERQADLEERVQALTDADLEHVPAGLGDWSWGKTLLGLVAHDCYHTGQIVKLRQLQDI